MLKVEQIRSYRYALCSTNKDLLEEVKEYKPENEEVGHLRFLLYGPVGAGKSSFINSVTSSLVGRMSVPATVNTSESAEKSFTVQVSESVQLL